MADAETQQCPFPGARIATLAELNARFAEIATSLDGPAAHFGEFWFDMPIDPALDPVSAEYRASVLTYYHLLASSDRQIATATKAVQIGLDHPLVVRPWPYSTGSGEQVGQFLQAIGFVIATCKLRRGHRVLQLGAGAVNLALPLARMGCAVTCLDSDWSNIAAMQYRAERAGVTTRLVHSGLANAADALNGELFDFVVLYSTLHRSDDHIALLKTVRERLLARGGRLVLAGEPLLETLPVPWSLDPSGGAIWTMRHGGGVSLVFRPSYLLQALTACGYAASLTVCPQTALGNVIVAVRGS